MYATGIDFVSFYNFSTGFGNVLSVVFSVFSTGFDNVLTVWYFLFFYWIW